MSRVLALFAIGLLVAGASAYDVTDFNFTWTGYGSGTLDLPDGLTVEGPGGPGLQYSEGYFSGNRTRQRAAHVRLLLRLP